MSFASPGVTIKEIDLTATLSVSDQNIACVVLAAEAGPVDSITYITSEKELVDTFGYPNNNNYESWFAAQTIIQYGGIVAVIRPSGVGVTLKSAYSAPNTITNFILKNKFEFENYLTTSPSFYFAGRTPGSLFNSVKVVAVDHGVDQVITYAATTGKLLTFTHTGGGTEGSGATYTDVATTSNGSGTGATFTVVRGNDGTISSVTLVSGGENYVAGNTITIPAASIGGGSATNIVVTVSTVVVDPTVTAGDAIKIYDGATFIGDGWVYRIDTANNQLYITLADTTKKIPTSGYATYLIKDNAGTPVTLIAAGDITDVNNGFYDTLEYAPGLKWNTIAPQPGTSNSVASKGGKYDEMHVVVLDEEGTITGTPNAILEKYTFLSKAKDATTLDGAQTYFHSYIAQRSKNIYPGANDGVDFIDTNKVTLEGGGFATGDDAIGVANSSNKFYPIIRSSTGVPVLSFSLGGGVDYLYNTESTAIETAVTEGYELVRDSETFNDIDFLVPGKISLARANKLISIAEQRRDCMAVVSPRSSDVVNSNTNSDKTDSIIDFFNQLPSSSFAIFDSGYKYIYDKYNDTYRYVPCAADVAGLCISTTINSETWFSPAGYNRGNLRSATKLSYSPKQSERDRLYSARINPIVAFPGQGIVLFGDKTALASPSAFNRINVRRLFIELEKNVARFAKYQLFEINDEITRSSFKAAVEPYLRTVQGRRGIYDFLVVCDETNNTPAVIDANEFNAEIYIKPARSINFITITFIATRTGISFSELVN